jgi:anthranilate phosphoribosyltransferase
VRLYLSGRVEAIPQGIDQARELIRSGAAGAKLRQLQQG